jgi:hypothetical protein
MDVADTKGMLRKKMDRAKGKQGKKEEEEASNTFILPAITTMGHT